MGLDVKERSALKARLMPFTSSRTRFGRWLILIIVGLGSVVGASVPAAAQPLAPTIVAPANGAAIASQSQLFSWTSVANAQAYYLYVGTSAGTQNVVDTGSIQATSYQAAGLPMGQTLYARVWAKVDGVWRYTDSTFSVVVLTSTIVYPANGAVNASMAQAISWTSLANAQAYFLYVGTTVGANNLINTGAITATSYSGTGLPSGQTLYARVWVEVAGIWRYTDSTFSAAASAPPFATITYPANGAVGASLSQPITWTTAANAQSYYLYVGTAVGTNNLINTGEIHQTSWLASGLPAAQTLYVRLWTRGVDNIWRYADSTFSAAASAPLFATITYPTNGALNANMTQPIAWTTVANAQAYFLYVGTTVGANDLVNTGEVHQTSWLASNLPPGQTLYARIWTKLDGIWRSADSTFKAAVQPATVIFPANGAINADMSAPIRWTVVPNVQAYFVNVGTTLGATNLVNSGETTQTSYQTSNLPTGQTLYLRLWTKVNGIWASVDSTFSAAAPPVLSATLAFPSDGAVNIDQVQPATWDTVPNADAYYLYVGTTVGAKDVADSQAIHATSFPFTGGLPAGRTLYARLWTEVGGVWRYKDSTFTAAPNAPVFTAPHNGALAVNAGQPFTWTPPASATAHQLLIGTTPGTGNVFDSGSIAVASSAVPALPAGVLYARALSLAHGVWKHTDIAFTVDASSPPSVIDTPTDGEPAFDTILPFSWTPAPLARGYRLRIGRTAGASDLHDSGEIAIPARFVPNLPLGLLYGRLETKIDGQWYARDFTFSVAANTVSSAQQIKSALWATDLVRGMSPIDNRPFAWGGVFETIGTRYYANCVDYALTLLHVLQQMNSQLQARRLDVALNLDGHTLVEMLDSVTQRWILLDPTFDLTVSRTVDDVLATAEDMSAATRSEHWSDITYQFLGPLDDYYVRNYYLDYPLLFVDLYRAGDQQVNGQGGPVALYMETVSLPASTTQVYVVGCLANQTAELLIDGVVTTVDCSGVDGMSAAFNAATVAATAQTSASVTLYRPRRFLF